MRAAVVAASPDQAADRLATLIQLLDSGASRSRRRSGGGRVPWPCRPTPPGSATCSLARAPASGTTAVRSRAGSRWSVSLDQTFSAARGRRPGRHRRRAAAHRRAPPSRACGCSPCSASRPTAAVGHSLGELTALHWAGAMDESELLDLAAARGRVMAQASEGDGAMASIAASPDQVEPLLLGADGTAVRARRSSSPATTARARPSSPVRPRPSSGCAARPRRPTWSRAGSRSRTPSTHRWWRRPRRGFSATWPAASSSR